MSQGLWVWKMWCVSRSLGIWFNCRKTGKQVAATAMEHWLMQQRDTRHGTDGQQPLQKHTQDLDKGLWACLPGYGSILVSGSVRPGSCCPLLWRSLIQWKSATHWGLVCSHYPCCLGPCGLPLLVIGASSVCWDVVCPLYTGLSSQECVACPLCGSAWTSLGTSPPLNMSVWWRFCVIWWPFLFLCLFPVLLPLTAWANAPSLFTPCVCCMFSCFYIETKSLNSCTCIPVATTMTPCDRMPLNSLWMEIPLSSLSPQAGHSQQLSGLHTFINPLHWLFIIYHIHSWLRRHWNHSNHTVVQWTYSHLESNKWD